MCPARILVVDDDASVRTIFSTKLVTAGYVVETAQNGAEALQKSQEGYYNLALIDIRLPDMEGTELLTALKETTPRMRKIIVTGYPDLQNALKAANNGANGYVTKPVDLDVLLRKVAEELEKQSAENEYAQDKIAQYIERKIMEVP